MIKQCHATKVVNNLVEFFEKKNVNEVVEIHYFEFNLSY